MEVDDKRPNKKCPYLLPIFSIGEGMVRNIVERECLGAECQIWWKCGSKDAIPIEKAIKRRSNGKKRNPQGLGRRET